MPDPLPPAGTDGHDDDPLDSPHDSPHDSSHDSAELALRRVLAAQAAAVDPGDAPRVGDLVDRHPARRWPAALAVAASVAVLAVTSAVLLQPDGSTEVRPSVPSPTPSTSTSTAQTPPSASPTATSPAEPSGAPSAEPESSSPAPTGSAVPPGQPSVIVWACRDDDLREWTVLPERRLLAGGEGTATTGVTEQEARVAAALAVLDSQPAADPDHVNYWATEEQETSLPGGTSVRIDDDGTTVDFDGAALGGLSTGATSGCLVETLVRTVVSNGGTAPVTFLLDGEPAAFAELDFSDPARPSGDRLAGGWVLDPFEGQRIPAGTVTLSGTATAFEATVRWEVLDEGGSVVADGFTTAGSNGEYGPWTVPVELSPGSYTVVLWADDMSGDDEGTGPRLWEDTTTITVVP